MKISLEYFLRKQRITLVDFCKRNKIENYYALTDYCSNKRMVPITLEVWKEEMTPVPHAVEHSTLQEIVSKREDDSKKTVDKPPAKKSSTRKANKNPEKNESVPKTKAPRRRRRSSQKSEK